MVREDAVKGLRNVADWHYGKYEQTHEEDYLNDGDFLTAVANMLEMQEPLKPVPSDRYVRTEPVTFDYKCVVCNAGLVRHWVCCPCCGQAVKWE